MIKIDTFAGFPILFAPPNMSSLPTQKHGYSGSKIEVLPSHAATYYSEDSSRHYYSCEILTLNKSDNKLVKDFFLGLGGDFQAFWLPTWINDAHLAQNLRFFENIAQIQSSDLMDYMAQYKSSLSANGYGRYAMFYNFVTDQYAFRYIQDIAQALDAAGESVQSESFLIDPLGFDCDTDNTLISFLLLCRLTENSIGCEYTQIKNEDFQQSIKISVQENTTEYPAEGSKLPIEVLDISAFLDSGVYTFVATITGDAGSYYWMFGDDETSEDASPTHTYAAHGSKTVTLLVGGQRNTDYKNMYHRFSKTIVV